MTDAWPVHPAQRALLHSKSGPQSAGGNCVFAYRLSGDAPLERLLNAYRRAVDEFDALRLQLVADGDDPVWRLVGGPRVVVRHHPDISGHVTDEHAGEHVTTMAAQLAVTQFDPATGPIGTIDLIPSGSDEWVVVEAFDHVIADGRALTLLHRAVSSHYTGTTLAPAPAYRSVLEAVTHRRAQPDLLPFWRDWFRGFDPTHDTADIDADIAENRELRYDTDRVAAIERAAGRCRSTLAATLFAAHAHAIARHLSRGDVASFLAVDGRDTQSMNVFGQLASLLPIRVTHHWSQPLGEHLAGVGRRLLQLRDHLDIDMHELDQCGAPTQLAAADAAAFIFQDRPVQPPKLGDFYTSPITMPDQHDAGGLTTVVHRDPDGEVRLRIRTPAGSALQRHIDSITATVDTFINVLLRQPDCPVGDDDLLPQDAGDLIRDVAEPVPAYPFIPVERAILQRLRESNRTAVIENGAERSTQELLQTVHQRTRSLRAAGVRAGQAVIVDDTTAFERIASFLAILELGGVYVPVDPGAPVQARTDLEQQSAAVARLSTHGAQRLQPDTTTSEGRPDGPLTQHHPAYVIFTSGTTGEPKGVLVSRGALANLAHGEGARFDIGSGSRVLLIAPATTDPWICHVTGTLIAGGTLVAAVALSDIPLSEQLRRDKVSHAFLPASLFSQLEPGPYPDLRMAATAGDHCRPEAVRRMYPRRVVNIYGPTEATVTATMAEITESTGSTASTEPASPVSIGRPIRGLGARVMIDGLASAPPEVTGELTLNGIGLAIGYLNDSDATRSRFRPDPLRPGHRLYTTGDHAWLGRDGQLYLAGRADRQVKIRGHRVELGQVETAARASGLCTDAYAMTTGQPDQRLVLFVEGCAQRERLADELARVLPPPARPRTITAVDQLPRRPSGTVDAALLPSITASVYDSRPRADLTTLGPAAAVLAPIWQRLLGTQAHPADDFFGLGGDSLDVLRLVREARHLGLPITPTAVYRHTRFGDIVAHLTPREQPADGHPNELLPLSPSQQWFFNLALPEPNRWNQHHHIAFDQLPDESALAAAISALLRMTPILTARVSTDGIHYPHQHNLMQVNLSQAVTTVSTPIPDDELADLLRGLHNSLNPARGTLIRAAAIRAPDSSGLLLLVAHHLVVDDWSWRVIEDRLRGLLTDSQPEHGHGTVDHGFARFTSAIAQQAAAGAFTLDAPAWTAIHHNGHTADAHRRPATTQRLETTMRGAPQQLAVTWKVPLPAVLLACLGHGLATVEPGGTTVIDLERNGRTGIPGLDTSDAVGWFALHHPLPLPHTDLNAAAATDLQTSLAAIPDVGLGFGVLVATAGASQTDQVGRLAVNIATAVPPEHTPLLDQLHRCAGSATGNNHLPYEGSVVFRVEPAGVRVELAFDPDRLSPTTAAELLHALTAAPTQTRPTASDHRAPSPRPFDDAIPATAMQQLMLEAAGNGPRIYRPRQLLILDDLLDNPDDFLMRLEVFLGALDPFRRRFHRTTTGIEQWTLPAASITIDRRTGGLAAAQQWLEDDDAVDADAATQGGPLANLVAFSSTSEPLCLGMQIHHAILDGPSNHRLLTLIDDLIDAYVTRRHAHVSTSDPSATTMRKHASAERALGGTHPLPGPRRTATALAAIRPHHEELILPGHETGRIASWALQHAVDLRAGFAAAALATVYRVMPGEQVYLVGNGRDPDIPGTDDALGLFWYFQPLTPETGDPTTLAKQVFQRAAQPLREIRRHALAWPTWLPGHGMSFNFLKPETAARPARLHTYAHHDLFHFETQIEVTASSGEPARIRWTTMSQTHDPRHRSLPQLVDYIAELQRLAE